MFSKIINRFRLVLPLRWSRHWIRFFANNNLTIKERQFVRMLHVINEVTIDTCDIDQIKENAEVKSNRWLSIQMICSSTLVYNINPPMLDNLRTRAKDLVFELKICHSFLQGQMIKAALTDYSSICKPLYYLKKGTYNLTFLVAYRRSFLTFGFCWLELFQYHKCLFGIVCQLTMDY